MKIVDDNGVEVTQGDWVISDSNDYIPTIVDKDEHDGSLYITTYHATLDLKDCRFTKCDPCKAERCCDNYGDVKCTYHNK